MRDGSRVLLQAVIVLGVAVWATGGSDVDLAAATGDPGAALQEGTSEDAPVVIGAGPGRLVVDLTDGVGEAGLVRVEALLGVDLVWVDPRSEDEALAVGEVPDLAAALAALYGAAEVEAAEPSVTFTAQGALVPYPTGAPNDPLYPKQWNLVAMGAPAGWAATPRGAGVIVAVIDTGVTMVEDLAGVHVMEGASFVPGVASAADGNGHGTHVAGTIAQATNNGVGVAGVAPAATILPVKVLSDQGSGSSEAVAAGIDWAVDQGAQVINLSLGGPQYAKVIHVAAEKARDAGVLVVAAAGNDGKLGVSWPGALREVIGVSAIGPDGFLAPYSNYGLGVDVAAPGGNSNIEGGGILQDTIDGAGGHRYRELQGTSMATPHVSGALAALLSTGLLSPIDAERALLLSADSQVWDPRFGHGRIDLGRALELVGAGVDRPWRFALGGLLGWVLAAAATSRLGFRLLAATVAAVVAGGVFFGGGVAPGWTTVGALHWPMAWAGLAWGLPAAWVAAVVPVAATLLFAPFRPLRAPVLGLAAGLAVALAWGGWRGGLAPAWLPGASWWFGVQVVVCVGAALVVAGVQRVSERTA
jgi:serine protease